MSEELTKEEKALGAFLAAMDDSKLDGGKMREAMIKVLRLNGGGGEGLITVEASLRFRLQCEEEKSKGLLDEVRELKSRIERLKAAPQPQQAAPGAVLEEWQPIETAKNGDVVLAYGRNSSVPGEPQIWTTIRVDHLRGHWTTGTHSYPFAAAVWIPPPVTPSAPKPQGE